MRILMAGVSGFLGTRLVDRLTADGHQVTRLVRRPARSADERQWNPSAAQLDPAVLADADAVVNLAGAGVGDRRWTDGYRRLIRTSRVDTTSTLAITIAGLPAADRPAVLL
ncbi:NAD-dependent epimerase/dehydratase family protein, partial [Micromonospora fluostatini]